MRAHFASVAAAVDVPLILYNQPRFTGSTLSTKLVLELAESHTAAGIKDSSGNLGQTLEYLESCPDNFSVLLGNDAQIAYGLMAGASGAVAASANVVPKLCVGIYDAMLNGKVERGRELQRRVGWLRSAFELGTFPVVVKEALALIGESVGPCRRPIAPLTPEARSELSDVLAVLGCAQSQVEK